MWQVTRDRSRARKHDISFTLFDLSEEPTGVFFL